jgi:CBS domain containing-hemolysin-like protein
MNTYLPFLFLVGLCSILSFLFSGMEAGVFALSRLRIRQQMRAGKHQARVLYGFLENTENFLWTIFVGNTLVNFVAVSLVVFALLQSLGLAERPAVLLLVLVGLMFLFYAFCDLLPKMLFRLYPNRLCLALAIPFRFIHSALAPLVSLMAWISKGLLRWSGGRTFTGNLFGSREELRQAIHESGVALTSEERAMINRVLDLQNLIVGEIALPMSQVLTATAQMSAGDLLISTGNTASAVSRLARQRHIRRLSASSICRPCSTRELPPTKPPAFPQTGAVSERGGAIGRCPPAHAGAAVGLPLCWTGWPRGGHYQLAGYPEGGLRRGHLVI